MKWIGDHPYWFLKIGETYGQIICRGGNYIAISDVADLCVHKKSLKEAKSAVEKELKDLSNTILTG